jgi:exodeoxyribonuclease VII small subunit
LARATKSQTPIRRDRRLFARRPTHARWFVRVAKDCLKWLPRDATFASVEATEAKLSFEAALGRLETIVDSMESGEVPLADLLAKFEDGTKLLKLCEARLKDAELKIEQLKKQKDGTFGLEQLETDREA